VVNDERGPRAYENFSGGEKMRVDLSIRMALAALLAKRSGARMDMVVLDEACASLDIDGRECFVESLQQLSSHISLILVITHIPELRDKFPVCIDVRKDGDGSHVEVGGR
ncbi:hypothetical protein LCGC14_2079250, partial [marine sediment metagenome]